MSNWYALKKGANPACSIAHRVCTGKEKQTPPSWSVGHLPYIWLWDVMLTDKRTPARYLHKNMKGTQWCQQVRGLCMCVGLHFKVTTGPVRRLPALTLVLLHECSSRSMPFEAVKTQGKLIRSEGKINFSKNRMGCFVRRMQRSLF